MQIYPESEGAEAWSRGVTLGSSQNIARRLMAAPANFMTPVQFCVEAESEMAWLPVKIKAWAEQMKMGSFLSVSRGSAQPARFLQMEYSNGEGKLILADALCYADSLGPRLVADVATLTGP